MDTDDYTRWLAERLIPRMNPNRIHAEIDALTADIDRHFAEANTLPVLDLALSVHVGRTPDPSRRQLRLLLQNWIELERLISDSVVPEPVYYNKQTVKKLREDMKFLIAAMANTDVLGNPPPDVTFHSPAWMVNIALEVVFRNRLKHGSINNAFHDGIDRFNVGISDRYQLARPA